MTPDGDIEVWTWTEAGKALFPTAVTDNTGEWWVSWGDGDNECECVGQVHPRQMHRTVLGTVEESVCSNWYT
jgi:hypothetical protein